MQKTKLRLLTILVLILFSLHGLANDFIIFSGKIQKPNSDSVYIRAFDMENTLLYSIALQEDNSFRDTLNLNEGYYYFFDGVERTLFYLKPGFNLSIELNTKEFDETIKYSGKGSIENNYLAQKALNSERNETLNHYSYYAKLDEKDFLNLCDSLVELEISLLNENTNIDPNFKFLEENRIKIYQIIKLTGYEWQRRYVTKINDFKVSANYPDPSLLIDLNDEKLLAVPEFTEIALDIISYKVSRQEEGDYNLNVLVKLKEMCSNKKNREEIAFITAKYNINQTEDLESFYKLFLELVSKDEYRNEIFEKYNQLKKLTSGNQSPSFELNDINGKSVSLESLKGKLVYIDIWATWCGPCMTELPFLEKLQEELNGQDIHFVSICTRDNKKNWEKMVNKKELKGIQLFGLDTDTHFFEEYLVNGIPHFTLLDKEGKIIDAKAKRPSNPELKKQLEELLK